MSKSTYSIEDPDAESVNRQLVTGFAELTRKESGASDSSELSSLAGTRSGHRHVSDVQGGEPSKKKRRVYPKVRTGCDTCKRRKVKCDESGFPCRNCAKSGRDCLGYHPPKAKLFESLHRSNRLDAESEEKLIIYFQTAVAVRLTDLRPLQLSLDLWTRVVPLLAVDYPAVRHAMLALAAIHERFDARYMNTSLTEISSEDPLFALEQYTEALRKLSSGMSSATTVINTEHLVCCLLLTLSDLWHFGIPLSFRHVLGGLEFCRIVKKSSPSKSPLPDATGIDAITLIPAFEYFADSAIISLESVNEKHTILHEFATKLEAVLPLTLPDLDEAYALLDKVLRHLARVDGIISTDVFAQVEQHLQPMLQVVAGMQSNDIDRRMLHVHYQTVLVLLTHLQQRQERAFTEHEQDFCWIVNEVEDLLQTHPRTTLKGCIAPLFLAATKCRNARIRQKALDVMHRTSSLERLWTSCTATQIANEIVRLESDARLTEQRLISLTGIKFHHALNQIEMEYTVEDDLNSRNSNTSVIAWSRNELEIDVVHSRPDSYTMPKKVLSVGGYSMLMLSYRMGGCHC